MHELFVTVKPKKIEQLQTVEPHTDKNITRSDRSGYIWDYAEMPQYISEIQQKELEKAWSEIPKKYTRQVKKLIIRTSPHIISTGQYIGSTNTVIVNVGCNNSISGAPYTLQHEVHHNMWQNVRTALQKKKWKYGVREIMMETGKSSTIYSDSFAPSVKVLDQIRDLYDELAEHKNNVVNNVITIDICYPNYDTLKKDLNMHIARTSNWFNKIVYPTLKNETHKKRTERAKSRTAVLQSVGGRKNTVNKNKLQCNE